jgi:hypothetical protein
LSPNRTATGARAGESCAISTTTTRPLEPADSSVQATREPSGEIATSAMRWSFASWSNAVSAASAAALGRAGSAAAVVASRSTIASVRRFRGIGPLSG